MACTAIVQCIMTVAFSIAVFAIPDFSTNCDSPISTSETAKQGFFNVTATDTAFFSIVNQSAGNFFNIDPKTGVVIMSYIDIDDSKSATTFFVVITANNTAGEAPAKNCTLDITITDVNDIAPVFSKAEYNVNLTAPVIKGSSILNVTATDRDRDPKNNQIKGYTLNGTNNGNFSIDVNGHITAKINLSTSTTAYTLGIVATDNGSPAQTGAAKLSVCVGGPCSSETGGNDGGGGNGADGKRTISFLYILVCLFVKKVIGIV